MRGPRITSPGDSDSGEAPVFSRTAFLFDLEQLGLQVEVMALKVDEALQRSTEVLLSGDLSMAEQVVAGDDPIDDMQVSLTERCYDLLSRQNPVASDLRLVVSVLRVVYDLERTGDLCLRIVKLAPDQARLASNPETFVILATMADDAKALYHSAMEAWSSKDLALAKTLEKRDDAIDSRNAQLSAAILRLEGAEAVPVAVTTLLAGRALERIADHAVMMGERISYMLTGDLGSLSREIG